MPSEAKVHTKAETPILNAKSERSQLPIEGSTSTFKAHTTYHTRVCHDYGLEGVL